MVIRTDELPFLEGEKKIIAQQVFLEETFAPTTRIGSGIPTGILMLTNTRLLFFNMDKGKSLRQFAPKEAAILVVSQIPVIGEVADTTMDIVDYIIDKLKDRKLDLELYINREGSFAIPVEQIMSCEKFGSRWLHGLGVFYYKRSYLRITIIHDGVRKTYCIYCVNPKDPLNAKGIINLHKWYKQIVKPQASSPYLSKLYLTS